MHSIRHSPAMRARRLAFTLFGAVVLVTISGILGATLVKSPQQVAAETGAPPPSLITAPVVEKVLSQTVVIRGTFGIGNSMSFAPGTVASTAANAGGTGLVVTGIFVTSGASVRSGQVVAEVSDRPVYVLAGRLQLWRDLVPGESGKDVAQLQTALADLGYGSGNDPLGYFGPGTENAVREFYRDIGYAPPIAAAASSSAPATGKKRPPAIIVPMSEAWFVPRLPAEVLRVGAQVGESSPNSLMTIAEGSLALTAQLDPSEEALVKPGMRVSVYSEVTGYNGTATVSAVGTRVTPAGPGGGAYVSVRIRPARPWPASLNGQNVEVSITAVTTGHPVLAVPVSALSYDASGQAQIVVVEKGGAQLRIVVRTGVSAGGYVEVALPGTHGVHLKAGAQVVVGR